jgi:hypothetical protein
MLTTMVVVYDRFNLFFLTRYLTSFIFGIVEALLLMRFILKLFGANAAAPFVNWIYETTSPLINPFVGAFPSPNLEGVFVFEFGTLFALLVYMIMYLLVAELLAIMEAATRTRV